MLRLKQFPIRAKLFGLAGILLAFTALIGFMSVRGLAAVDAEGGSMYRDRAVPLHDLGDARSALGMIDNQLLRTIVGGVDDTKQLRAAQASVDEVLVKYKATELVDAEKRGLAAFDATWQEYKNLIATDVDAARYEQQAGPLFEEADKRLGELLEVNDHEASALDRDIDATFRSSRSTDHCAAARRVAVRCRDRLDRRPRDRVRRGADAARGARPRAGRHRAARRRALTRRDRRDGRWPSRR